VGYDAVYSAYQHFGEIYCLHFQGTEAAGSMFLLNFGADVPGYTVSHPAFSISVLRLNVQGLTLPYILRGADKSLAFSISYLQHNQKNFSWMD
jgi:hypothetical protein